MAGDLVLVTGATGAIGFRILIGLLKAGYKARVVVRSNASYERITKLAPLKPYLSKIEKFTVTDIEANGAYDEAVKGVTNVIHLASPTFPTGENMNFDTELIQPAIKGTVGMLNSALKEPAIKRVVITSSALALAAPNELLGGELIDAKHRTESLHGPFDQFMVAYWYAKIDCFNDTEKWMAEHEQRNFEIVNIQPSFVVGRDDRVTDAESFVKGTNAYIMGPLLGIAPETPYGGAAVHVDDVVELHVRSLDPSIPGNSNYVANTNPPSGIVWADGFKIIKKHFPKECADGTFKVDSSLEPQSIPMNIDSSATEKTFGIKFRSWEEIIVSLGTHYLELLNKR